MVPDLAGLLRALVGAEVRFVVSGGIAVAAHQVVRATEDIDNAAVRLRERAHTRSMHSLRSVSYSTTTAKRATAGRLFLSVRPPGQARRPQAAPVRAWRVAVRRVRLQAGCMEVALPDR